MPELYGWTSLFCLNTAARKAKLEPERRADSPSGRPSFGEQFFFLEEQQQLLGTAGIGRKIGSCQARLKKWAKARNFRRISGAQVAKSHRTIGKVSLAYLAAGQRSYSSVTEIFRDLLIKHRDFFPFTFQHLQEISLLVEQHPSYAERGIVCPALGQQVGQISLREGNNGLTEVNQRNQIVGWHSSIIGGTVPHLRLRLAKKLLRDAIVRVRFARTFSFSERSVRAAGTGCVRD